MPSSLIIVALVVAWLAVLVPMIVRKRQEIARTADSALAARVVRSGDTEEAEEAPVRDAEDVDQSVEQGAVEPEEAEPFPAAPPPPPAAERRYRPGRGGFDPEAAAVIARAKYAFRQRVVLAMIVVAVVTGVLAGMVFPILWPPHGMIDATLIGYLVYLRRQVRIEQEIRERRLARMQQARRLREHARPYVAPPVEDTLTPAPAAEPPRRTLVTDTALAHPTRPAHPNAVVVDLDDEDPAFDELDHPDNLPYRRASGE
ncbi:MAG TPA: gephyrin-like molybdotransferase receptor GlpR [Actinophytocola sp.]|uniref:divisome protein SepX/GlpR n=1 Tax=Actinophytocola sp. TaxID=1872138 RepID=UPI002DDCA859|nr:gephyrin-like molybdotransferase receptor GlpR [Actinophytocola sp.]HEV2782165.1 gephyrin-like molybdotransferase receptor GlpR [Actinophytocola sp.]